ncbi:MULTISPECIES: hypothetical protein [Reichenbachiella]|uniref:Uncharacterized protein n=1 Tax=Reichenbachiella agariperforans TaxID=156994 RepID=A0A1M6NXW7_REIAG|nr:MULTISPECIES: hypothetical protein [Reichenbachiella]MBU2916086.1 hypothetical protein [Reichenbachiella agariperforans]RJE71673.1 hypothetical protein BGP76_06180 [Reichenbachiella sp. MSK19-1]SHK00533.1 hypothetical protein SAMN04488028_102461 [Reichenbachiella agariperforans]
MNEFLDKHGYRIFEGDSFFMIRHKSGTAGCVHLIFGSIIFALILISFFLFYFMNIMAVGIFTVLALILYLLELGRRQRDVRKLLIDMDKRRFQLRHGKKESNYSFEGVFSVVSTTEHIGGYASSDRDTTEEYKREINVLFKDGFVLTVFSYISDYKSDELEAKDLIDWLENLVET